MERLVIGITGGMGAGKTTLARRLRDRFGAASVSIDEQRRLIGGSDKDDPAPLWERVLPETRRKVVELIGQEHGVVLLEWARLIEDGFLDLVDKVVILDCDEPERLLRLHGGDLTPAQIKRRLALQLSTSDMADRLAQQGVESRIVDARGELSEAALAELYDELTGAEFQSNSPFCLFRIPRQGGRAIWEVTNRCDYGCRYCIFSSTPREPVGELDTAGMLRTVDELRGLGFTHIKFTGGEPLARPDLMEILRHAKRRGFRMDLSTNASRIDDSVARELSEIGLEMVHVSLDGHTKEIQEAARGARTYAPTLAGLRALLAHGANVRVGCVVFKGNQDALMDIASFCHGLGCGEIIFSLMEPVGRARGKTELLCDLPSEALRARVEEIRRLFEGRIKVSGRFDEASPGCGACPGGERFLFINHKGEVSPCTWVSERAPSFISKKTLRLHSLGAIVADPESSRFREIVSGLAASGLERCPMRSLPAFIEASETSALFEGDLAENLARGGRFSRLSPAYLFSTENIGGWIGLFDFAGADVLTVGASGDQMISAYAAGAKSVSNFDINLLAKPIAELKLAMLRRLSREEFLTFFSHFDFLTYGLARDGLSLSTRSFFDQAYRHAGQDGARLRGSPLFRRAQSMERLARNIPYLADDASYLAARRACEGHALEWTEQTAEDAAKADGPRYDIIVLSNLGDYARSAYEGDYLQSFRERVAEPMAARLKPRGQALVSYVFDAKDWNKSRERSLINDPAARGSAFGRQAGIAYREAMIPSAWEDGNSDLVLTWEKPRWLL